MVGILVLILLSHLVGDFFLQSNKMAVGKSTSLKWLGLHVLTYSACFLWLGLLFTLITFVTHFLTDFLTSKLTSKLWFVDHLSSPQANLYEDHRFVASYDMYKRHWFFVMIGIDQFIHMVTLIWTLNTLTKIF